MAIWQGPPKARKGHRIEDYQFNLLDVNRAWLGQLTGVHKPKGKRTVYGQFKGFCTFSLPLDNAWSKVLKEEELHKLQVLRDGLPIFEGYQVQLKRTDDGADTKSWNEFMFVPLARLLYWRYGKVITGDALSVTAKVDDAMKWVVERTGGPTAPVSGTSGTARAYAGLTVAADKTEHPTTITFNATLRNIYEALQWYGMSYTVDWDIYFDAVYDMIFETWYPQRGTDKTAGSANPLIWTDTVMGIAGQDYGWDAQDQATLVHDATMSADVVAAAGVRAAWLVKELAIATADTDEMQVVLNDKALRVWYLLRFFKETQDNQWGVDWVVGDQITWQSNRMGFGPHDDLISEVEWSIDEDGWETLKPILGEPELKSEDRLRGGGTGARRPEYIAQRVWHLEDVANTAIDPDSQNTIMLYSSDDSAVVTSDPAFHRMNIQSHWISAAGEVRTRVANDDVVSNGGTGDIGQSDDRWDNGYYEDLNVAGTITLLYGTISAPGGNDVRLSATTDDLELDAAGEIRLTAGGNILFSPTGSANELALTSTSLHPGTDEGLQSGLTTNRWSTGWFVAGDFEGDVTIGTGVGIIHADSVAAGKILIADGARFIPADLSSIAGHWTVAAGTIYTTVANKHVITNGGTGTIGLTGDRWDGGFFEVLAVTGTITLAQGTISNVSNDLVITATADDLFLVATGTVFHQGAGHQWKVGGAEEMVLTATALYPFANSGLDLGLSSRYWGTLYIGTVVVSGLVDGVDIAAFKTAYDAHTHGLAYTGTASANASVNTLSGITSSWDVAAYPTTWNSNPVRDVSGNVQAVMAWATGSAPNYDFVYMKLGAGGTPTWVSMTILQAYIGSTPHHHAVSGTSGFGTILATAIADAHTHLYDKTNTPTGAPS